MIRERVRAAARSPYGSTFGARMIILTSGLINSIVLARGLGPGGRGELAAAVLFPSLLLSIGALGLYEATLIHSARDRDLINAVATNAILSSAALGGAAILAGHILIPRLLYNQSSHVITLSQAFLLMIPFGMLHVHLSNIMRAQLHMIAYNLLQLIIPVGLVAGAIILAASGLLSVDSAVFLQLGLTIVAAALSFIRVISQRLFTRFQINPRLMRDMLSFGIRVYPGTLFYLTNVRLDQVLLASLVTPEQLGYYAVAAKVAEMPGVFGNIITTVAVPKIASIRNRDDQIAGVTRVYRRFWPMDLLLKLVYAILLSHVVALLYGGSFLASVPAGIILVAASLFQDSKQVLYGAAQALKAPWLGSRAEIVAAMCTVLLLFVLVPTMGILGAAVASLVAYMVAMFTIVTGMRQGFNITMSQLYRLQPSDFSLKQARSSQERS